jgi:hypothetical protein
MATWCRLYAGTDEKVSDRTANALRVPATLTGTHASSHPSDHPDHRRVVVKSTSERASEADMEVLLRASSALKGYEAIVTGRWCPDAHLLNALADLGRSAAAWAGRAA